MSSDETDTEAGKTIKTCLIRRPYWRAPEVGLFLHTIDSVSAHVKIHEIKPGGQRRRREPRRGLISHRSGVVPNLPKNFYTTEILNQGPGMYDKIRPQDEVNISHHRNNGVGPFLPFPFQYLMYLRLGLRCNHPTRPLSTSFSMSNPHVNNSDLFLPM